MSWWLLLVFIFLVWCLWAAAATAKVAAYNASNPVMIGDERGVLVVPVIPVFPLIFWGAAKLIDLIADPWGTIVVASFHAVLAIVLVVSIARDTMRLRAVSERALVPIPHGDENMPGRPRATRAQHLEQRRAA